VPKGTSELGGSKLPDKKPLSRVERQPLEDSEKTIAENAAKPLLGGEGMKELPPVQRVGGQPTADSAPASAPANTPAANAAPAADAAPNADIKPKGTITSLNNTQQPQQPQQNANGAPKGHWSEAINPWTGALAGAGLGLLMKDRDQSALSAMARGATLGGFAGWGGRHAIRKGWIQPHTWGDQISQWGQQPQQQEEEEPAKAASLWAREYMMLRNLPV
jgi:hypothetical protein